MPYPEPVRSLVTGGAGFIGSHLVDVLVAEGAEVTVLDNLTTGRAANLDPHVRFVPGSILDADLVDREIDAADEVFHLAAAVGVRYILEDPVGSLRTNIRGTENVLESCAAARYARADRLDLRGVRQVAVRAVARGRRSRARLHVRAALVVRDREGHRRAPRSRVRGGRAARCDRALLQFLRTAPR